MSSALSMEKTAYISFLFLGLSVTIPSIAMPFLLNIFGMGLGTGGLLFFAQSLGYIVASSTFPWVFHRLGSQRQISWGILLSAMALALLPFSPTWVVLLMVSVAIGFGLGSMDVGLNAAIAILPSRRSDKAMHWLHFSFSLGALIGPVFLIRFYGLSGQWTSLYFLGSLLFFLLYGLWTKSGLSLESNPSSSTPRESGRGPYGSPWFWLMMICMLLYCGAEVALASWLTTYLVYELAASVEWGAVAVSLFWGGLALGRGLAGFVSVKLNIRTFLLILFSGSTLGTAALSLIRSIPLTLLAIFMVGFFFSAVFPSLILYGTRLFSQYPNSISGGMLTAAGLGGLLIPTTVGFVGDYYSLSAGFMVLGLLLLVSLVLVFMIPRQEVS